MDEDESLYFSKFDSTKNQTYSIKNDFRNTSINEIDESFNELVNIVNKNKFFKVFLGYIYKFKKENQVLIIEFVIKNNLDVKKYLEGKFDEEMLVNEVLNNF